MDFALSPRDEDVRARIAAFVEAHILPLESDPAARDDHDNIAEAPLQALRARARSEGLWCPQLAPEHGGMGLSFVGMAAAYEAMNRSIFGPVVFNAAAPDDGTMMALARVATPDQRARWLAPIAQGLVRSAFAMTEPAPGGGSDPGMILTEARRVAGGYTVHGTKWFITGAGVAAHFVVVARTSDDPRRGLTALMFPRDAPGWRIVRRIPIMGPEEHGGHCELAFDGLFVPDADRLMAEGDGLRFTQIRLGPARLTHCMRWLGLARRCTEIARAYAAGREGFGQRLADRESIRIMLGTLAMDIDIGRLLVMRAAWELDQGRRAQAEISMAKVHVANLLHRAADTAIQINGARGYSRDTVLEWIYRYARQARLVDGADEVHRMLLARHLDERGEGFWRWPVAGP